MRTARLLTSRCQQTYPTPDGTSDKRYPTLPERTWDQGYPFLPVDRMTGRYLLKHYLHATSLVGSNKKRLF